MATFLVTDPTTGVRLRLTGDSPPTEAELEVIFSQQAPQQQPPADDFRARIEQGMLDAGVPPDVAARESARMEAEQGANVAGGQFIAGLPEAVATIGSSIPASIASGIAGIAGIALPGEEGQGKRFVEATQEALTFQPRTEVGKGAVGDIAGALAPAGEFLSDIKNTLGDTTLELTGSPFLATVAHTLPDALIEVLGLGAGRKAAQISTGLKSSPKKIPSPTAPKKGDVSKSLVESAPEVSQLKDVSRGIYKEISDLGVTIQPKAYDRFVRKIINTAKSQRVNKGIHPKSFGVVEEFTKELSNIRGKSILDIDDLRTLAQDAAGSIDASDARIGLKMIDDIDQFLDTAPATAFKGKNAKDAAKVGERYKAARNIWGRARRAELIEEAFTKADRQASGLENGLRTQLRQIVNNKKRARFFTKDEIAAMDDVIKGSGEQNALKLVGRLGFSEGGATNVLGGLGGIAVLGPAAPVVGQISRKLAQRATRKGFDFADTLIRAGNDGTKITKAYLQVTPKAQRSVSELSELLANPDIDLKSLLDSADKVVKEAAEVARGRRAFNTSQAVGALAPAAQLQEGQ